MTWTLHLAIQWRLPQGSHQGSRNAPRGDTAATAPGFSPGQPKRTKGRYSGDCPRVLTRAAKTYQMEIQRQLPQGSHQGSQNVPRGDTAATAPGFSPGQPKRTKWRYSGNCPRVLTRAAKTYQGDIQYKSCQCKNANANDQHVFFCIFDDFSMN